MPKPDPDVAAHLEWLGFIQPAGLVVSATALKKAGAVLNRRDAEGQRLLRACAAERRFDQDSEPRPWLPDFRAFAKSVLGWSFSPRGYAGAGGRPVPPELEHPLPDAGETLRPDYAVVERDPLDGEPPWQLLVQVLDPGRNLDRTAAGPGRSDAAPHGRMERLLRATGVPAGLLFNGRVLRLVSAPRGESSGWMDFRVADMHPPAGRPLCAALRLLLNEQRLLALPRAERLAALLADSRAYQNEVSELLAEQVLHALYELLRGFQAADGAAHGALLRTPLADDPDEIYRALLTVVLRLVFLLYAEERDLLPADDETFARGYSLAGLYERLREDAALHPDTMDQRFGAWAQLLALFRMIHDGARSGAMQLPARPGVLFDPDRFKFLEGRPQGGARQIHERAEPPLVPDGTIYRALEKLLVLAGERISYRALDVEQIGSVYETMMGFRLETAAGPSVAIRAAKKHGAPATVDVEALLLEAPAQRTKWVQDRTDRKLTDRVKQAVREAGSVEALHAALDPLIDRHATPDLVPAGAMVLQPSEERRRSGSHYTPRALTEPIVRTALAPVEPEPFPVPVDGESAEPVVRTTLAPVLGRLRGGRGKPPRPERILDLKVCDPAMGTGAFLVEACRQLADALVESWRAHDAVPEIPPDEDEVIFARRLVARRCLYGVDRNPVAVDLAKLSLWLATLAKDHPLTFLDHALRHGDSLAGLSRRQLEAFHWDAEQQTPILRGLGIRDAVDEYTRLRRQIREADEDAADRDLRDLWDEARYLIRDVRCRGDLVLAAFFEGAKPKQREKLRLEFAGAVAAGELDAYRSRLQGLDGPGPPLAPFHWEIEFPEVFERENPGFDAIVGNPPFAGKNTVAAANVAHYPDWLKQAHPESHGNADLVAHFFRRAFDLVRRDGAFGLIATNTIAQGDTRSTGLRWICEHGGEIYRAQRRIKWPGLAAVVVSVLHVAKGRSPGGAQHLDDKAASDHGFETLPAGSFPGVKRLDGEAAETITAFLFHRGSHDDPARLQANAGKSFVGSYVLGMGFTFDDRKGVANPLSEMRRLIESNLHNQEIIFPYIGGEEVNTSPTHEHHRYVINFRDWPLRREEQAGEAREGVGESRAEAGAERRRYPLHREDAGESWADADDERRRELRRQPIVPHDYPEPVAADWPELLAIVEERVKPERQRLSDNGDAKRRKERYWLWGRYTPSLFAATAGLERVLANSQVSAIMEFAFLPSNMVYAHTLNVYPYQTHAAFCALQSRPHEIWARFFGSSLGDGLRYTPSDCFETFPFPERWETRSDLEAAGKAYYDFRAALMIGNDEGLTRTYNRFHDRYENDPDIARLRDLHAAMDRAVLDAYGWSDLATDCEFLLDYAIDEEEWGRKKKPWRYRWSDAIRDEVLARLLELNAQRAAEEERAGAAAGAKRPKAARPPRVESRPAASASLAAERRPLWGTPDE